MKKGDIIDYCKKYVSYQSGIGNQVSIQECYQKQLSPDNDCPEDRIISEIEIRKKSIEFAEEKNTKLNNPIFHSKLLKLIENLNKYEEPLSQKLIRFLIDIGEIK
jgi:hypothetical protein